MNRWAPLALTALCACRPGATDSGLLITVELETGLTSRCVQVVARIDATERRTKAIALEGRQSVTVAIARGDFPESINLQAVGFHDEACLSVTDPPEVSDNAPVRFIAGVKNAAVRLHMRRSGPPPEQCTNGLDDDANGATDCADSTCEGKACQSSDACLISPVCSAGSCVGGPTVECLAAPGVCFEPVGACQSDGGTCVYTPRPNIVCDDSDPCTVSDLCSAQGACTGTAKTCTTPPAAQCFAPTGTCGGDGGCSYAVTDNASCSDQNTCTVNDRCDSAGACAGTLVICQPRACGTFSGSCTADGGCLYTPFTAGTQCGDAGMCNGTGGCIPPWPYTPSNFTETQLPTLPEGAVTLGCGDTVIDTSTQPPAISNWCVDQPMVNSALVTQPGEREAMAFSFTALTINGGSTLRFIGSRPAIVAVEGDAVVLGRIVAESGSRTCAAGAGANGTPSTLGNGGAGGAGFGSAGAAGGVGADLTIDPASRGSGGAVNGEPLLSPLRGGCSGGRGGESMAVEAAGGGALQLTVGGQLTINGAISAPGRGGIGGAGAIKGAGGNGGGSGGALLLEARNLLLVSSAQLTANGGGAGEGGGTGQTGANGTGGAIDSATPAQGGNNAAVLGGRGGNGATVTSDATAGENGGSAGGGGGGGLGRIRINTQTGCNYVPGLAVLSPVPTSRQADAGCP
ncbi:MAG: hypothetical protein JNG84_15045 [Archangium sp.]|nr:hypothetical protein [Archangium sp.]